MAKRCYQAAADRGSVNALLNLSNLMKLEKNEELFKMYRERAKCLCSELLETIKFQV